MAVEPLTGRRDVLLIQFAKSPVPGQVKTRMMPFLDANQAAALHRDLLLWTCRRLCTSGIGSVEVWVSGNPDHEVFTQCREHGVIGIRSQVGADLGERMRHALADGLQRYRQVILVGSDCPSLDEHYLRSAQCALVSHPVVLGPADDGGYVLIGATDLYPELFVDIPWGRSDVFAETVKSLQRIQVGWQTLGSLPDIDRPEDLAIWRMLKAARV